MDGVVALILRTWLTVSSVMLCFSWLDAVLGQSPVYVGGHAFRTVPTEANGHAAQPFVPASPQTDSSTFGLQGSADSADVFAPSQLVPTADQIGQLGTSPSSGALDLTEGAWRFNFEAAPWPVVLRNFARTIGMPIQFLGEPSGSLTYFDDRAYSVRDSIDILNDHLLACGCIMIRDDNRLTVVAADSQIPDALIPYVSVHEVGTLGRNHLATVALPIQAVDPRAVVAETTELLSPLGRVRVLSASGRVVVTDTGAYLRRIRDLLLGSGIAAGNVDTVVVQLRHSLADDVAEAINSFLSGQSRNTPDAGGGLSGSPGGNGAPQRVVAEKTTNSLLVRGSPEEISGICQIIQQLDRAPREVQVQALLVEVMLGKTDEFGVELGIQDSVLFDRSVVDNIVTITETTTLPTGVATSNQRILSQTSAPGFNFNNQPLGNNTAIQPGTIGKQGLSSFGVGRVNGDLGFGGLVLSAGSESVNVLLRALDANYNLNVLSRPQIRTLENHEALIQIGQQVPIVDGVSVTAVGSANPVIRQDQAGIILKVTPRISPDGRVLMDVNAEKSAYNLTRGTGVPIFTDATNGNVIEAPIKDITTAETSVSVQSGQTIVLGGMIGEETTTVTRKVPWLGDIPLIGRAFRYDLLDNQRKELLVFLTPIVVENNQHSAWIMDREISRIQMPPSAWDFLQDMNGAEGAGAGCMTCSGTAPFPEGTFCPPNSHSGVVHAQGNSFAAPQFQSHMPNGNTAPAPGTTFGTLPTLPIDAVPPRMDHNFAPMPGEAQGTIAAPSMLPPSNHYPMESGQPSYAAPVPQHLPRQFQSQPQQPQFHGQPIPQLAVPAAPDVHRQLDPLPLPSTGQQSGNQNRQLPRMAPPESVPLHVFPPSVLPSPPEPEPQLTPMLQDQWPPARPQVFIPEKQPLLNPGPFLSFGADSGIQSDSNMQQVSASQHSTGHSSMSRNASSSVESMPTHSQNTLPQQPAIQLPTSPQTAATSGVYPTQSENNTSSRESFPRIGRSLIPVTRPTVSPVAVTQPRQSPSATPQTGESGSTAPSTFNFRWSNY
ncbi:MAG: hypothetical protein KDA81_10890 [Planctomycetaceae bacterium]|nr:hypothetical protein [Planctomycetaceae bacterium]